MATNNDNMTLGAASATPAGAPTARLQQAAARSVEEAGTVYNMDAPPPLIPKRLREPHKDIAVEAVKAYEQQKPVVEAQAKKSQEGLDIALQAGVEYDAALREHQDRVQNIGESAAAGYDAVVQKVEGNAQLAAWNVGEGLRQIEGWASDIMDRLDVNKARDIATGVQSTVEGMNQVDREMEMKYGRDSDEFRQYQQNKAASLGSILQSVQTTYSNNITQLGTEFADIKAKYKTEAEMYASFERQQAGNVAKDMELASANLNLQIASDIASTEMLITANQENMANWIIETPVFGMDSTALLGFIGSLAIGQWSGDIAAYQAKKGAQATASAGKMSMWGSIAGAGMMAFGAPMMMV